MSYNTLEKYELLLQKVNQMLGVPYLWGGKTEEACDCSGLIQILYKAIDLNPPGELNAQMLYRHFAGIKSTHENVFGCGSLVFFGLNTKKIHHVGMLIDVNRVVEAGGGGPDCTSIEISKTKNACVKIRPLTEFSNVVAVLRPEF